MTDRVLDFILFLIHIAIAIGVVHGLAWLTGDTADQIVGWAALGIAVGASSKQ